MKKLVLCLLLGRLALPASGNDELAAHVERARAAQEKGDFVLAAAEWRRVVSLRPDLAEGYSNLGMMLHFGRDYPKSIAAFQTAIRLNPNLVAPHLFRGIDCYLTSRPSEAIAELKTALTLDPPNTIARKWLAMAHFQLGEFFAAARGLNDAIERDRTDPELVFWLSRTYSKILVLSYEHIRRLGPDSVYLRMLREQDSPLPDNRNSREKSLIQAGRAAEVLAPFETSAGRKPTSLDSWYWVGKAAQILGLKVLDFYILRVPDSYRVHQLQAEYSLAQGNEEAAIAEYRKALSGKPDAVQLHAAIGNIFMSHHDYQPAVMEYEAELQLDAYSLLALQRLGQAWTELHEPGRAEGYLKRAAALDPRSFETLRALAKVRYDRGDYAGAVHEYLKAINSSTTREPATLYQLSQAYRKLGNAVEGDRWQAEFKRQLAQQHAAEQRRLAEMPPTDNHNP